MTRKALMGQMSLVSLAVASIVASAGMHAYRATRSRDDYYLPPRSASHDAERIAQAEAKRARKAAKRAKQVEASRAD